MSTNREKTSEIGLGKPDCDICDGLGYYVPNLLPDEKGFGRAVPCSCRRAERDEAYVRSLLHLSQLGALQNHTFDNFVTDPYGATDQMRTSLRIAYQRANEFAMHPEGWLILQGGYGCGKTHLAAAIANIQIKRGNPVLFVNTPDLLDHLRATFNPESTVTYDERFDQVRNAPLLVLDDLGTQSNSPWAQEKLYQIINHRYTERLPTVITTNLDELDFEPRIRSRMFHEQTVTTFVRIWARDFRQGVGEQDQSELSTLSLHSHLIFENFETQGSNSPAQDAKSTAQMYAEAVVVGFEDQEVNPWLVLYSTTHGNGKTHLAAAIANYVARSGNPVLFVVVPDLLDYLRAAFDPSSRKGLDRRFDEIRKTHSLVVLDDLGTESATPFVREKLYQLFNYRYLAALPTVITTSVHEERLDAHLVSRMKDTSRSRFFKLTTSIYRSMGYNVEASTKKSQNQMKSGYQF